ncbi:SDR family oxidoreductase [Azospira restricta]|uniref:SDR family oxidoreductase n=1 Tax=Azospira restricta TaxID=404405 RepID=A0A974SPR1_9RHOO|nr:SDR family oxidoreductase [Azospira restricta]QRJ64223.1 SDR family oxidoreductase [Azospira restricta]
MQKLLIVGCGDVAWRALPRLVRRYRVFALLRDAGEHARWRAAGAVPLAGNLDAPASLGRLAGLADAVLHLAPPPDRGDRDPRTRHLLAALGRGKSLPQRLIYISTSGVYGDCGGAFVDETRRPHPETARAARRLDAERALRAFGRETGTTVGILRAPGIYAADRLPLERLAKGTPALADADDVFTNHIHADDLAAACCAALVRARPNRSYNVCDDSHWKMGEYFDRVADAFALPRPPRLTRADAERQLSPLQLSFMRESRRLSNRRLHAELHVALAYPTVADGILAARKEHERKSACSS